MAHLISPVWDQKTNFNSEVYFYNMEIKLFLFVEEGGVLVLRNTGTEKIFETNLRFTQNSGKQGKLHL